MFDWREFHTVAARLAKGSSAGEFRSASSRAYYFAYHVALPKAVRNGYQPPQSPASPKSTHVALWAWIQATGRQKNDRDVELAGDKGKSLRLSRNRADYNDAALFSSTTALHDVTVAQQIETLLKGF